MKKKNYLIISGIIFIVIIIGVIIWYSISVESKNFIKLNYSEVLEKVNNKESFILCVSASECIHCNSYRPKLKKISNDYNIKIYYTDVDNLVLMVELLQQYSLKMVKKKLLLLELKEIYP